MIQGAALLRAQLGVALRGCPSELRCFSPDSHPRASRIDAAVGQLARELECAAPGIALMLQLRARFFDAAVRGAWRRGIRQLATIGVGFDDGRLRTFARRGGLVLDVDEHAVILAKASHHGGVQHLPVVALDRGLATAMARLDALRAHAPTFFLVQNASLWTTADTLRHLLAPCRSAVAGSELLLNVFARDGGRGAPDEPARFGVATPASAAASSDAIFTTLMRQVDELRLQVRARLDSGALQRRYVGFDDLLVRESYLWLRTPGRTERDGRKASVLAMLAPPAARVRRTSAVLRATDRPQLRPDLVLRPSPSGNMMIARSVTPLRTVGVCATPTEIAAALLLDGSRSLEDVTDAVVGEDRSVDPANVIRGVERLHVAGLLVDDAEAIAPIREVTSLRTLATSAMDALRRRDRGDDRRVEVRKVLDALGPFQANPVLRHLRTLVVQRLRGTLWATVIGNGSMHVLLGDDASPAWGREVLADAIALLARIGATLGLAPSVTVLIDVTPSRRGIPLTWVETAEPYTLIRIPRPSYSRRMLAHELTHVVATGCSPWLAEGLAVWMQRRIAPGDCYPDDLTSDSHEADEDGAVAGSLARYLNTSTPPLTSIGSAAHGSRATYRRAATFVEFFIEAFGLPRLLSFFTKSEDMPVEELERAWHESLRRRDGSMREALSEGIA